MSNLSKKVFPLCQHLDALVDELRGRVPGALDKFEEDAIHKARVATRRLKAALELLSTVLNEDHSRPFERLGKRLRRRLGPMRDIDVMLSHLDQIKPTSPLTPAAEWLRQRLIEAREHAREESIQKAPATDVLSGLGSWWALRQDVIDADPAVESLLVESLHTQLDQFIQRAGEIGPGSDPHELRIAGKALRYTLELAKAEGHILPAIVLRTFKRMQECLGTWHDYVVLAERAMQASIDEDLPLHHPAMQRLVLKLVDHAMRKSQRELDRFARLWADHGGKLATTIREEFAGKEVAIAPQMDPDPAGSAIPSAPEDASTNPPPAA